MKIIREFVTNWIINFGAGMIVMHIAFRFYMPWTVINLSYMPEVIIAITLVTLLRMFTDRFDFKYYLLERLLDCALVTILLVAHWWFFGWERFLPLPSTIVCIMAIYLLVWFVHTSRTRREVADIRKRIQQRKDDRDSDVKKYIDENE